MAKSKRNGSELPSGVEDADGQPVTPKRTKKARNIDAPKQAEEAKKRKPALPKVPTGERYVPDIMRPADRPTPSLCFMSWNVAGLRALLKKHPDALQNLIDLENVDVLCLQEHKLQEKHTSEITTEILTSPEWSTYWACSSAKLGYSGVAVMCRNDTAGKPLSVKFGIGNDEHDLEGRVVTVELADLFLVNVYVPNSGEGLKRLEYRTNHWDRDFAAYLTSLQVSKPVVVTGDLNCAREPIDIHNPHGNLKSAGFTPEERESFQKLLMDAGWVDTFREQHPGVYGYTYYSYRMGMRAKGKGWRLDYFLVSPQLASKCHDSFILTEYPGSDHCPIGLILQNA